MATNVIFGVIDAEGRKARDVSRITKKLLTSMGFTAAAYNDFRRETEHICGANMPPSAKANNKTDASILLDLARTHLFPKWNDSVEAGLHQKQHSQFWTSWMADCNRTYHKGHKKDTNKPTKSLPSFVNRQSSFAPTQPRHETPAGSELSLTLRPRSQTPIPTRGEMDRNLTWRDVIVKVSFRHLNTHYKASCGQVRVPLARCVNIRTPVLDEDTKVVAARLELSSLTACVWEHWTSHRGITPAKVFTLCMALSESKLLEIRYSHDLHKAFNHWLTSRTTPRPDWWLLAVPPHRPVGDKDSEMPDSADFDFDFDAVVDSEVDSDPDPNLGLRHPSWKRPMPSDGLPNDDRTIKRVRRGSPSELSSRAGSEVLRPELLSQQTPLPSIEVSREDVLGSKNQPARDLSPMLDRYYSDEEDEEEEEESGYHQGLMMFAEDQQHEVDDESEEDEEPEEDVGYRESDNDDEGEEEERENNEAEEDEGEEEEEVNHEARKDEGSQEEERNNAAEQDDGFQNADRVRDRGNVEKTEQVVSSIISEPYHSTGGDVLMDDGEETNNQLTTLPHAEFHVDEIPISDANLNELLQDSPRDTSGEHSPGLFQTPLTPQALAQPLGHGDEYDILLQPGEDVPAYRIGDDQPHTSWLGQKNVKGDTQKNDDPLWRPRHIRPQRFAESEWRRAAGFPDSPDVATKVLLESAGVDDDDEDELEDPSAQTKPHEKETFLSKAVLKSQALTQWSPEMWSTIATYLMCSESTQFAITYQFKIPGANPRTNRTPAQMYAGVWMKCNERKVMGGIISDQVGTGKSRETLASVVADRAYLNRMWEDWEDDLATADAQADIIPAYVRRHLGHVASQHVGNRCPSARKWLCQCVCEAWGVTHTMKYQPGPTLILANAQAIHPWVDEFNKMFRKDPTDPQDTYKNRGFGKAHGFSTLDRRPFRLIICHEATAATYARSSRHDFSMRDEDKALLQAELTQDKEPGGKVYDRAQARRGSDRLIILTTRESYNTRVEKVLQKTEIVSRATKRAAAKVLDHLQYIRFGTVVLDEAHVCKTTPPALLAAMGAPRHPQTFKRYLHHPPFFWCVSGTPFANNIFHEIGSTYGPIWEDACLQDGKKAWTKPTSWMYGYDKQNIKAWITQRSSLSRGVNDKRSDEEIVKTKKRYVAAAAKYAARLMIQRDEETIIQGSHVTILPPVERKTFEAHLTDDQQKVANDAWEEIRRLAMQDYQKALRVYKHSGSRGALPTLEKYLASNVKSMPLMRAVTSFPGLVKVVEKWRLRRMKYLDKHDEVVDRKRWSKMTASEKYHATTLKLTVDEIKTAEWDRIKSEKESPYYKFLQLVMNDCHKKDILDRFWDTVAASRNAAGLLDKALVFSCSPAATVMVYNYYKHGCNEPTSPFRRRGRRMNVILLTSGNSDATDRAAWVSHFQEDGAPKADKFLNPEEYPIPDIIVTTTGIFGTGQNVGRARYALVLEPQPNVLRSTQVAGRIRRGGHTEQVYVWDAFTPNSGWETIQRGRNTLDSSVLQMIKDYEKEAFDAEELEDVVPHGKKRAHKGKQRAVAGNTGYHWAASDGVPSDQD